MAKQTSTPPLPPDVRRQQQGSPLQTYADQATQAGSNPAAVGAGEQDPSQQYVKQALTEIAERMSKLGKILGPTRPELMPILKQMAGAGKALENELSKSQGQASPAAPSADPAQETPEAESSLGL